MTCSECGTPAPQWNLNCDACCVRKVMDMPTRNHRRQVLVAVRLRRGKHAEERIRKLVEETWQHKT